MAPCHLSNIFVPMSSILHANTKIWNKRRHKNHGDNKYLSGYFEANIDGTIRFNYNNQHYIGSWRDSGMRRRERALRGRGGARGGSRCGDSDCLHWRSSDAFDRSSGGWFL